MKTRILTAAVGLPVLIVVLLVAPLWVAGVAMGLICTLAAYELLHMALGKSPRRLYFSVMLCAFVLPVMFSIGLEFSWAVGVLLLLFFVLSVEQMVSYTGRWRITLDMIAVAMLALLQHPEREYVPLSEEGKKGFERYRAEQEYIAMRNDKRSMTETAQD